MSDDREHIRQQRRLERERKEQEFQAEMVRYEEERQARLEARRKAREAESGPSGASSSVSAAATSDTPNTRRTIRRTETQKAIEANLDEWEEERKERLAEREQDALERKAALETQLALEEAERNARAETRRKEREAQRKQEEAEETARAARLEARRLEREAQRLAEEKEFEEKQAARRRVREERDRKDSSGESKDAGVKEKDAKKDVKKDVKKDAKKDKKDLKASGTANESSEEEKRAADEKAQLLNDYNSWGSVSPTSTSAIVTTHATPSAVSQDALQSPRLVISDSDSHDASSSPQRSSLTASSDRAGTGLAIPRPESPTTRTESPVRRKRLGERGRSSDAPRPALASSTSSISSSAEDWLASDAAAEQRQRDEEARKEKEAQEQQLLQQAADAEMAHQAAQDAAIREEMRREEEAILHKEQAAEKANQAKADAQAAQDKTKAAAASKMRSLVGLARQQQLSKTRISTTERPIAQVPPPITHRLTTMELFSVGGGGGAKRMPDPDMLMNHFVREGRLARDCVTEILLQVRTAFLYEKNVVTVKAPALVIGDIHGQFFDLLHLFKTTGLPGAGENHFVFLGDYVDRGTFSCEVCLILFACKLRYGDKVTLLRGNHETRAMSSYHNFQQEATHKYGPAIYEMFMEVFDHLPLAAIVDTEGGSLGRVFCCHGGLSPSFKTVDEIQELDRVSEPADDGAICDLIWADPVEDDKFFNQNFSRNKERGCSVVFGYNPLYDFLDMNNFSFIVRAHQVEEKGYREQFFSQAPPGRQQQPMVVTLFSAPNYCDSYENMAAYLSITKDEYNFHQYSWQQHPYCLPDFSNAFKFSLPFVAENLMKFLVSIIETIQGTDLDVDDDEASEDKDAELSLEQKLKTVGKSFVLLKKMREASMSRLGNIVEQQQAQQKQQQSLVSGDTQMTIDALRAKGGRRKVQRVVSDLSEIVKMAHNRFKEAKAADRENERFQGRVLWKSTFRKLGRGVSFKV